MTEDQFNTRKRRYVKNQIIQDKKGGLLPVLRPVTFFIGHIQNDITPIRHRGLNIQIYTACEPMYVQFGRIFIIVVHLEEGSGVLARTKKNKYKATAVKGPPH